MSEEIILGIHSNVAGDAHDLTAGHAWLTITDRKARTTRFYGLWPDAHPNTVDNGNASDIRIGLEAGSRAAASRYYRLTPSQAQRFRVLVRQNVTWNYTHNCSSWASDIVADVVSVDVDADDYFGIETPRELGRNIQRLERTDPTSVSASKRLKRNPTTSIATSGGGSRQSSSAR